jgi:hypothetical protein
MGQAKTSGNPRQSRRRGLLEHQKIKSYAPPEDESGTLEKAKRTM